MLGAGLSLVSSARDAAQPVSSACAHAPGLLGRTVGTAAETVAGAARVVGRSTRALASPTMIAGVLTEVAWATAHLATYPTGLRRDRATRRDGYRIEHLPPTQRGLIVSDVEAANTPILLVHGLIDNRSIFTVLRTSLARRGFGSIAAVNYSPFEGDVRVLAARLAEQVERLVEESGYERIHLIGHSLGGIVARYYVTRLGGDERVHTLVTLGSPHGGSVLGYLVPAGIPAQLRPGSALVRELAAPVPGCRTRFIAYWSDLDELVFPQRNAAIRHPDLQVQNIALHGVGHASLPNVPSVARGIADALAQLDPEGRTVTPGATPIAGRNRADA
jgi:pimeloyl-ACP methyl ester carboxylesterase